MSNVVQRALHKEHTSPGFCVLYISRYEDRDSAPVAPPSPPPPRRRKHACLERGERRLRSATPPRLRWQATSSAALRRIRWSSSCNLDARQEGERERAAESKQARAGVRLPVQNPTPQRRFVAPARRLGQTKRAWAERECAPWRRGARRRRGSRRGALAATSALTASKDGSHKAATCSEGRC